MTADTDVPQKPVFPGADENTPSRAQYFSWINNTNEGSTEAQTLANLAFFGWLRDEYGMQLDIYAWDAGNIDGAKCYGSMDSERFREQYPNGFGPIHEKAKSLGIRLGIWGGPDGFGDTPEEEQARIDMMVRLCRDYEFMMFKFDGVCGRLRPEKQEAFVRMMTGCREHSPDLILLNHRLDFGIGNPHSTTFLWEGRETYIDVHIWNEQTAPHHRAGAMSRGTAPEFKRLTEDHGVCLSSCLDYWDDDLVLQAFHRCMILAPEVYGNPWLLRDDEYPKLARIYNLHRCYRDILVDAVELPESRYGPHALSRGDKRTRLITLRNLTWEPKTYSIELGAAIGLQSEACQDPVELRQFHPTERVLGRFGYGDAVEVSVPPFRSCLLLASADAPAQVAVEGCDFEVVRDMPGKLVAIKLLGLPGTKAQVRLCQSSREYKRAEVDGANAPVLLNGGAIDVQFPGTPLREAWHRKLADLAPIPVPADAEALYEATCFAADNNALEARELRRSGPTAIPHVQHARDAFFNQNLFWARGIWDRYLFDGKNETFLNAIYRLRKDDLRLNGGALRVDFGQSIRADTFVLKALAERDSDEETKMLETSELQAEISEDLTHWHPVLFAPTGTERDSGVKLAVIDKNGGEFHWAEAAMQTYAANVPSGASAHYLRLPDVPERVAEFEGHAEGRPLDRTNWRASNLFSPYGCAPAVEAWAATVTIAEAAKNSCLAVAVNGCHGVEGAYAAARANGKHVGAPDRAPSFQSNVWECRVREVDRNYTYFIPVRADMIGVPIDVVVLGKQEAKTDLRPEVWLTCYPPPFEKKDLVLT